MYAYTHAKVCVLPPGRYRTAYDYYNGYKVVTAQWSICGFVAVIAVLLILVGGLIVLCLQLELVLFRFIDKHVCYYLSEG